MNWPAVGGSELRNLCSRKVYLEKKVGRINRIGIEMEVVRLSEMNL